MNDTRSDSTGNDAAAGIEGRHGLLALAIRRPVGVMMVVIALLVFGFEGYRRLPITLLPELSYPTVTVRTAFPGASPEDVEDRISEPIREAVSVLASVTKVTTISRPGQSDVMVEFAWGTPMLYAVGDLREKIDRAFLPPEVEQPLILRYDPSLDPIMTLGLSGKLDSLTLRRIAEDEIKDNDLVTRVEGVAAIKVKGGDEKEILIAIDPTKLASLGLDIRQIASQIGAENLNASAGVLEEGETEYLVRAMNEFRSLDEVARVIIARRNGANIRLQDVAVVTPSARERQVITRINGEPAVLVEVFKQADANLVSLATRLKAALLGTNKQRTYLAKHGRTFKPSKKAKEKKKKSKNDGKKKSHGGRHGHGGAIFKERQHHVEMTNFVAAKLPESTTLSLLTDPSHYIENSIQEVLESALVGGILAVLVLFLFLRQAKPTLLISIAIPLSLIITFAPLQTAGVSLNVMSLGGLALGVGMLVDTSIVVLESITRCREEGDSLITSAFRGVQEVSSAVIASTATTVAVFLPIVFVDGIAGQLFRDQSLAVVFSLLVSLLVSLFLLPMLASRGKDTHAEASTQLAAYADGSRPGILTRAFVSIRRARLTLFAKAARLGGAIASVPLAIFHVIYSPLERLYPAALRGALALRYLVLLVAFASLGLAVWRLPHLGSEVLPEVHQGEFQVLAFLARDVDVNKTDRVFKPIEHAIRELPSVARTFLTVGVDPEELRSSEEGQHSARIHVVLAPTNDVEALEETARTSIRQILAAHPAILSSRFQTPTLFTISTPVSVEVLGHNLANLRVATRAVLERLSTLPELRDVRSTLGRGNTEVVIHFDRERLAVAGLEIGEAARRLSAMVQGEVATRYPEREKKIDMRVRLDPDDLRSVQQLARLDIAKEGTSPILLNSVAKLRLLEGPSEIRRLGGRRGAEVQGTVSGLDVGRVQQEVAAALSDLELPDGIELRLGGQKEEMERSTKSMIQALLLAIFLVYVVMAAQFESLLQPLVILFTVPLGIVGVVLTLDVLAIPLSVVVFLGGIMLAGIVVNNAIVLVDRMNQERDAGKSVMQAIRDGAQVRLRPVLMTTMTTVLGLLPLTGWISLSMFGGSGEGVELRAPMAITVIAGLVFSTLLTLFVIPVGYSFVVRDR